MELISSGGGVFEIEADGEPVHSKKATGEFPEAADVIAALRGR